MWQLIGCRALIGGCAAFIMPSTLSTDTIELAGEPAYQRAHVVSGVKELPASYTLR